MRFSNGAKWSPSYLKWSSCRSQVVQSSLHLCCQEPCSQVVCVEWVPVNLVKLVEVVTVVDFDDEDCVGNSLLQIWKLRNGHKAKLLFRLWAQGLVKILKLKFRQDFEAEVRSVFCCWFLVEILNLLLNRDFEIGLDPDLCKKLWYELYRQVSCAFGSVCFQMTNYIFRGDSVLQGGFCITQLNCFNDSVLFPNVITNL